MPLIFDVSEIRKAIKPKADSTLNNMRKADLIEYIRCLENNYNAAVWFNENQARYIEQLGFPIDPESLRPKWISVEDRLPETETEVLILARHGKRNVITTGMYEDGRMNTEDSDWWWETDGFEYDEELDVYIIPEGWWEYKHYIDDETRNYAIDGNVTHWMPLPEPPNADMRGEGE